MENFKINIERYLNEYSHRLIDEKQALGQMRVTLDLTNQDLFQFFKEHEGGK